MKKTKLFYGNQYIGSIKVDGRLGEKKRGIKYQLHLATRMAKISLTAAFLMVIGAWLVTGGIYLAKATIEPTTVFGKEIVEVEVTRNAPVMDRIAKCESGGNHIDPKTGQVYMLANTNKTVDVGKYMINTVWHKKAKDLGIDITTEDGNEKMAYYIYSNFGTEAWFSSVKCWSK